ncbi:hypothetical protein KOI35_26315 [Actinoplanes bogorensis]|uniref:ATP-binding protein n=1 Tax=Paractinoplanes bogorensis TaxID=1610840 RepID=A0ABS5YUA4_9ACTN|nr:hypothetical protein [Actinoplanes bogorensis]MBU2667032.1 hypothetical protein [Actinoplanes bogorensis]
MTRRRSDRPRIVCPRCWDSFVWEYDDSRVWMHPDDGGALTEVDLTDRGAAKRADYLRRGYRPCPNPSDDMAAHFIPANYGNAGQALSIGLVGPSESGKSHLLAAMIREALAEGLVPYGLEVARLDLRRHAEFERQQIARLVAGRAIEATSRGVTDYADMLVVRRIRDGVTRTLTFFDVAGEDLRANDHRNQITARFLIGQPALIFVHAAGAGREVQRDNNETALALGRLEAVPTCRRLPATIALTMADRLRFTSPVDRWIARPSDRVDAAERRAESRDLYAYLYAERAEGALAPFTFFDRCTLHAVSATGSDAVVTSSGERAFVHGYRPMRVLEPLVSLLCMAGVIEGREASKVGR